MSFDVRLKHKGTDDVSIEWHDVPGRTKKDALNWCLDDLMPREARHWKTLYDAEIQENVADV